MYHRKNEINDLLDSYKSISPEGISVIKNVYSFKYASQNDKLAHQK